MTATGAAGATGPLAAVDEWDVPHVAGAVFGPAGTVETRGDVTRGFALASVSKVLAAIATLVAVEEGSVTLEDAAGPEGSTVAHLLAHASGLAPEAGGDPLAAPGRRRIYSNLGFETLALHVAERTGMPFHDYATAAIVEPLGLTSTDLSGSPAHAYTSAVQDLAEVLTAVVNSRLLARETVATMTTPVFADLTGVLPGYGPHDPNPWGLGVEIRGHKEPHWTAPTNSPATWGHFGRAGTFVWFDPAATVGLIVLTDREFGPWAMTAWPPLSAAVLSTYR